MLELRAIAKVVDPGKFSEKQLKVWQLYNDVMDPKGEWLDLADKVQDRICEEVAINVPLLLASGGVASLARAGISAAGRVTVGRVLAHQTIKEGASFTAKELAISGGAWASETLTRRVVAAAARLGVEATVFETTHLGLRGQWIGDMPNPLQRIAFSAMTLGTVP